MAGLPGPARRLVCMVLFADCPSRPGMGWACAGCAGVLLARAITEQEAVREELLLAEAERIWAEQRR